MVDGLVSIIMPSWNTERFIGETIQSVLDQTYKNWELIIVDDCSNDCTDKVVESFKDERIRYFHNEKNSGAALTRNKAMRAARGEWIAFLDSDDLWMPEKLEHQISFMEKNGYSLSYTEYEKIDEESNPLNIYVTGPEKVNRRKMYNYDYIGQLTMMYSAKVFGLIQIKDIKKNNDYAIRLQLYKKPDTCAYLLKENLAKYRVRKVSISHDKFRRKFKSHYDLFHMCDGIDYLIKAVAIIKKTRPEIPIKLRIAGKGEKEEEYKQLAVKLGIADVTTWLGFISQEEAAREWANMDVAVIASTLESESFGVSAVEAEACGTAVIISDIPGLMEATKPEITSLVVKKCREHDLAEKLIKLYEDEENRKRMGMEGRIFVEDMYEINYCFEKIERLLKKISNEKQ